mgnify:CR=1 FL=1
MGRPAITICECGRKRVRHKWPNGKVAWVCWKCKADKRIKYRKDQPQVDAEWRENNRLKLRVQSKNFRMRNVEKERERQKAKRIKYQKERPDLLRKWYENHKNKPNRRYHSYKQNAKNKGMECLTFEEFMGFWQKDCEYCGGKIETVGIDRVDNSKGYIKGNMKSCCFRCNRMKREMGEKDFIEHCRRIVDYMEGSDY